MLPPEDHFVKAAVAGDAVELRRLFDSDVFDSFPKDLKRTIEYYLGLTGDLELLRDLHRNKKVEWTESVMCALCRAGHLPALAYLSCDAGCPLTPQCAASAAAAGRIDVLEHLVARGCPLTAAACEMAARWGQPDCLTFLLDHGCPCDSRAMYEALYEMHYNVARILIENKCPLSDDAVEQAHHAWLFETDPARKRQALELLHDLDLLVSESGVDHPPL